MKKPLVAVTAAAVVAVIAACRGSSAHFPEQHRAKAEVCSSDPRPPGIKLPSTRDGGPPPYRGACESDADCTAGKNGRCTGGGHALPSCSYDMCTSDADCGAGKICECGGGNSCLPANCRTDGDCGGLGCSPSRAQSCGNMGGTVGYYCHTRGDECTDDKDCVKPRKRNASAYDPEQGICVYQPTSGKWACNYDFCVG